jgi:hypothetical protein
MENLVESIRKEALEYIVIDIREAIENIEIVKEILSGTSHLSREDLIPCIEKSLEYLRPLEDRLMSF